jgi:hypothetical protein
MEGSCSTGQSPQRAAVPVEEEEEEEEEEDTSLTDVCFSIVITTPCYLTVLSSTAQTHENLHKSCVGLFRNRSTFEMAVTTYQSTWCNIPEDLYLRTKFVGSLIVYFQTNIFFRK